MIYNLTPYSFLFNHKIMTIKKESEKQLNLFWNDNEHLNYSKTTQINLA